MEKKNAETVFVTANRYNIVIPSEGVIAVSHFNYSERYGTKKTPCDTNKKVSRYCIFKNHPEI